MDNFRRPVSIDTASLMNLARDYATMLMPITDADGKKHQQTMVKPAAKVGRRSLTHTAASTPAPYNESESSDTPQYSAEALSFQDKPKPFKRVPKVQGPWSNANYLPPALAKRTGGTVKRNAKQILLLERERVSGGNGFNSDHIVKKVAPAGGAGVGRKKAGWKAVKADATPTPTPTIEEEASGSGSISPTKPGTQVIMKDVMTYHTPLAPPSLLPAKHYCDITGLPAKYTDPRTKLRYKGLDVWPILRTLGPGADQAYLAVRGAENILK